MSNKRTRGDSLSKEQSNGASKEIRGSNMPLGEQSDGNLVRWIKDLEYKLEILQDDCTSNEKLWTCQSGDLEDAIDDLKDEVKSLKDSVQEIMRRLDAIGK